MDCDRSRPSSGRVRQSPMEIVRPDLAAQIIEDALSPTPLQNVNPTSNANGHISHRMLAGYGDVTFTLHHCIHVAQKLHHFCAP